MVLPAPVTRSGGSERFAAPCHPRGSLRSCRPERGAEPVGAVIRRPAGHHPAFADRGKVRARRSRVIARRAPYLARRGRSSGRPDSIQARGQAGNRFTRGGVPTNAPRRRRRQIIVPALPATEAPRITIGGAAGTRVAASHLRRAGPLPASLSNRPMPRAQSGAAPRCPAAHRSSGLNDQAHADRRHPRGRNPRGGAGR
jgi:hypothetical protein